MKKKKKQSTDSGFPKNKTAEFKVQTIIDTISMTDKERSIYCLKHNIYKQNIDQWKKIILTSLDNDINIRAEQHNNYHQTIATKTLLEVPPPHIGTLTDKVTLHSGAMNYLYEHFYTLRRIFSSVLGQMETDYMVIAMINKSGQIFFLSSSPSIEQNMIEKNLWPYDGSFNYHFIYQNKPRLWAELYHPEYASSIYKYKQSGLKLVTGISIPSDYAEYRVVFSFGSQSENISLAQQHPNHLEKLLAIGRFCLQEITRSIPMLDKLNLPKSKIKLRLIFNHKVHHEKSPE